MCPDTHTHCSSFLKPGFRCGLGAPVEPHTPGLILIGPDLCETEAEFTSLRSILPAVKWCDSMAGIHTAALAGCSDESRLQNSFHAQATTRLVWG